EGHAGVGVLGADGRAAAAVGRVGRGAGVLPVVEQVGVVAVGAVEGGDAERDDVGGDVVGVVAVGGVAGADVGDGGRSVAELAGADAVAGPDRGSGLVVDGEVVAGLD